MHSAICLICGVNLSLTVTAFGLQQYCSFLSHDMMKMSDDIDLGHNAVQPCMKHLIPSKTPACSELQNTGGFVIAIVF